jgi:hypothetical protein
LIVLNIDVPDGLANGSNGILRRIDVHNGNPYRVWIEFDDKRVGRKRRIQYKDLIIRLNLPDNLTPIEIESRDVSVSGVTVTRKQFPLIPAEAITIVKSQGSTYENIVVCLNTRLSLAELYVAFSRCTSANGLYIIGDLVIPEPDHLKIKCTTELERMRKEARLEFDLEFIQDYSSEKYFKLTFFNVQSLNRHYKNVKNDSFFGSCDYIGFNETWTLNEDYFNLENFDCVQKIDCEKERKPYGVCTFIKNFHYSKTTILSTMIRRENSQFLCASLIRFYDVYLISVYFSPKCTLNFTKNALNNIFENINTSIDKVIIGGDFNININEQEGSSLIQFMNKYKLKFILNFNACSTNARTQIDLCFSNLDVIRCFYFENLFSFHKPIAVIFPKDFATKIEQKDKFEEADKNSTDEKLMDKLIDNKKENKQFKSRGRPFLTETEKKKQPKQKNETTNNKGRPKKINTEYKPNYLKLMNSRKNYYNYCYSNVAIQMFINCGEKLYILLNQFKSSCKFSKNLIKYFNLHRNKSNRICDTLNSRKLAQTNLNLNTVNYLNNSQQDAFLFLKDLLVHANSNIQELFQFEFYDYRKCICGHEERSPNLRKGSEINLNRNISRELVNFEEMFADVVEVDCVMCNNKSQILKRAYSLENNTFLFIRIPNESYRERLFTKIGNFNPEHIVIPDTQFVYKLNCAICHLPFSYSRSDSGGHFVIWTRNDHQRYRWLRISDENCSLEEEMIDYLEDVYVIMLEKLN